jgi:hypothetical protein
MVKSMGDRRGKELDSFDLSLAFGQIKHPLGGPEQDSSYGAMSQVLPTSPLGLLSHSSLDPDRWISIPGATRGIEEQQIYNIPATVSLLPPADTFRPD